MADVIAIRGCMGRCYSPVADVIATVTPSCVEKMPGVNISSDLEEAMFETGKSLSVYS